MNIREYKESDLETVIAIFNSNIDPYFLDEERAGFLDYLNKADHYLILEDEGEIRACGGYAFDDGLGVFCWGMVDRAHHKKGYGKALSLARLRFIAANPDVKGARLDTSQYTTAFYARLGFEVTKVTKDGYGPGMDKYDMEVGIEALKERLDT